jgi:hypothetical protein
MQADNGTVVPPQVHSVPKPGTGEDYAATLRSAGLWKGISSVTTRGAVASGTGAQRPAHV